MDPDLRRRVAAIYARADARVAAAAPRCALSGRCCDFPTSGHRLYASALETAFARDAAGGTVPAARSGLCPWHVDGLCRLRDGRPLGCRLYFCDPSWEPVMPQVYEDFHRELKALHERAGVAYAYRPFVDAVREADGATPAVSGATTPPGGPAPGAGS